MDRPESLDIRRTGRIFGWFFIGTFVTSIPARLLFVNGLAQAGPTCASSPAPIPIRA
jgi:hypothetical protein